MPKSMIKKITNRLTLIKVLLTLALSLSTAQGLAASHPVILISIDGFRADYLKRQLTPNLSALADTGVSATRLISAFPSVTFPNHFAIVTGQVPDHHGIVANSFLDPACSNGTFTMAAKDSCWWEQATPIWISAEQQHINTGTLFWPGSETAYHGIRPQHWRAYDSTVPYAERVDTLLSWLGPDQAHRPEFLTLYFEGVDSAGHHAGPDSAATNQALVDVDAAIGRLVDGLKLAKVDANLIIVSDHGMAAVSPAQVISLSPWLNTTNAHVVYEGALLGVNPAPTTEGQAVKQRLLSLQDHLHCYDHHATPSAWHYGNNPRTPEIICLADPGYWVSTHDSTSASRPPPLGAHGYDPFDSSMAALFIAHGPDIQSHLLLPQLNNVDVYPIVMQLLHLTPLPGDWDGSMVERVLRNEATARPNPATTKAH